MTTITPKMLDAITEQFAPEHPRDYEDLTFTTGARTAAYDIVTALRDVLDATTDEAAQDAIDTLLETFDGYADERTFTLYWLTGDTQTITGPDITTAANNAGIGGGTLGALDFWAAGPQDPDYYWDQDARTWRRKSHDTTADSTT